MQTHSKTHEKKAQQRVAVAHGTTSVPEVHGAGLKDALPEALKRFPAAVHMAERVEAARAQVEAARERVQAEFHERALRAQARLIDWQGKAVTLVEKAQDKARAEKDDVTQRVEGLIAKLPTADLHAKVSPSALLHERTSALLAAWLKLPADVRDDVLTVAGVATAHQTAQVLEEIVALRAELASHWSQTETKEAAPARRRVRKDETPAEA